MTTIYISATDQVLVATRLPKVACNNQNAVKLHVTFDAAWDGYAKSAVFYTSKDPTPYEVILSTDGNCLIPAEVLAEEATLYIGVKGVKTASSEVKASTLVRYKVLAGTPSAVISAPAPSVYQQLLTANSDTEKKIAVERARISNLLENGGMSTDGEVVDAHTGYDGTVYGNLFEAITGQIEPIAKQVKVKNMIDFKKLTRGYLADDGLINNYNNGFVRSHEVISDFIEVSTSNTYYFGHRFGAISAAIIASLEEQWLVNWFSFGLYDANKTFIKRIAYDALEQVISGETFEGAAYVRVSYRTYMFNRPVFAACSVPCEAMDETAADNLLETYPMIFNGYVTNSSGAVIGTTHDINGYIPTEKNELTSDFIPCEGGKEMFIFSTATRDNFVRIAFYRADGYFDSSIAYSPTSTDNAGTEDYENFLETFVIPENAVALRVSCRGAYITECVLAYNDDQRRYLFKDCERKYKSKYETAKLEGFCVDWLNVKAVNHRGYNTEAPENTLAAFRLSKKKGFTHVECDVSFTSDGVAVLLHDSTIDRTSNGTGAISSMTFEEVRALDFGSWKSEKYAGEQIPTFDEFVALCKRLGLHPYIELKTGTETQIKGLVEVVKRYGMKGNVTWISFNSAYLAYIKAVDPKSRLGYVVDSVSATTINTIKQTLQSGYNEVFVDCSHGNATEAAVHLCMDDDIPLEVWTVNSESALLALDPYVSGVTSDSLIAGSLFYENSIGG